MQRRGQVTGEGHVEAAPAFERRPAYGERHVRIGGGRAGAGRQYPGQISFVCPVRVRAPRAEVSTAARDSDRRANVPVRRVQLAGRVLRVRVAVDLPESVAVLASRVAERALFD